MNVAKASAFVTGAASGIGRAVVEALARKGADFVTLCDLDEAGLQETGARARAAGTDVSYERIDVTDVGALAAALRRTRDRSGLDILVNNAGIVSGPPAFPETPPERVKRVIDVNLTAVILGTIAAVELMEGRGGVVVNTASTGALNPMLQDAVYCATKAGVVMFTQSCKGLHTLKKVRVNAILPGIVDTPILDKIGGGDKPDWFSAQMRAFKIIEPSKIADLMISALIEDEEKAGDYVIVANEPA